ncbi:MGM101 [Candida oxycetoniae]|uniref:Mitochondrial genome maintenance protein MGM101 n=1 Tax=Candida oxycetoniae TaxID=497107 RepID=A0AAI9WXC2_9ASCO|nr:MGM101 [Candida oxycetoniae]KAI3403849.2 MGM101 [Candida oxycetoniae]
MFRIPLRRTGVKTGTLCIRPIRSYAIKYTRTTSTASTAGKVSKKAVPIEVAKEEVGGKESNSVSNGAKDTFEDIKEMSQDSPNPLEDFLQPRKNGVGIDWADSFHGIGSKPFSKEAADILMAPVSKEDIEIKPDGILYLPEIKYRRILNRAFGPGGWGLVPRSESLVTNQQISREYGLICHGRLVSIARGEQDYFGGAEKITTALEGCKSNALMRCCKDLGIASELWDPDFVRDWKQEYCEEVWGEHSVTKKKRKLWKLKRVKSLAPPYQRA